MKKILSLAMIFLVVLPMFSILALRVNASSSLTPEVVCVPFHGELLGVPHDAWIDREIILKGTAHDEDGDDTMVAYKWDFGDGYSTDWISGVNPYVIEARHTYTGTMADGTTYGPGKYFTAWLYVEDNEGLVGEDSYFIAIREKTLEVEVNVALDNGLWWLHKQQIRDTYADGEPYGYWHSAYGSHVSHTAAATEAFELMGHLPKGDPYDISEDPYVETVQRGLNYLFNHFYTYSISQHSTYSPFGNPDVNGNGIGLLCKDYRDLYDTGMALMTISSSGAPDRIATTGSANVKGRAYKDIAQDMVDYLAWGQSDPYTGVYEGGWRYTANYGQSDNSVSQWPVIGMEAAERNFGAAGLEVPEFVRPELLKWLAYSQNANGGFGYMHPWQWVNTAKTGAGCAMLSWAGVPTTDDRYQRALSFLDTNWYVTVSRYTNFGDYYTMYAIMKGMRIPDPDVGMIGTHDWYTEYRMFIVDEQNKYGGEYLVDTSWLGGREVKQILATAWAMAILLPTVVRPGPVADAGPDVLNHPPIIPVKFSGCGSYHRDPDRTIVLYEWDFESDGTWDYSSAEHTAEHAYPAYYNPDGSIDWDKTAKDYDVTLRVTDDHNPPLEDTDTSVVHITAPPWKPVADPNGPYEAWVCRRIQLDGSGSYDPESKMYSPDHPWYETIAKYEWDLDNDGLFDDSTEIKPIWHWETKGTYSVGLKVTDSQPSGPGGTIGPLDVDIKYTTVVIVAAPPRSIEKTLSATEGELGDVVHVTLTVTVPPGETVTIVDALPRGFHYLNTFTVDGVSATPTIDKHDISYTITESGTYMIEFDVKVDEAKSWEDMVVRNVVVGTWYDEDGNIVDEKEATADFIIHPCEELSKRVEGELTIKTETETQWKLIIEVTNTFTYTMTNVVIKDRFGAEIEIDEPFPDSITHGTVSYTTKGKSDKVFLTWEIGDLLSGETATLTLLVSTDINPAGHQEYTEPGICELNSGATLKFIDPEQDVQLSAYTDSIFVTVLPE